MARNTRPRDPRRYNAALSFSQFWPARHDVVGPLPHMRGLCRCGCGARLEGRQKQWRKGHEAAPLTAFRIAKGDTGVIRTELFKRDQGVCAGCAMDVEGEALRCSLWNGNATPAECRESHALREKYMLLGFPSPDYDRGRAGQNWWHADHIRPLVEGGTHCLENLRTLCVLCHRAETKALAARRAKARRPDRTEQFAFAHAGPAYGKFAVSR